MSDSAVLTGQYVRIQQTPASIGDRIFAQLIDWLVLLAYLMLIIWLYDATNFNNTLFAILLSFPLLFYSLLFEIFNQGQSLGKMVMKTRVVKADGTTPTLGAYLLRWLIFIVDGPLLGYMGILVIAITKNHQRLGDLAAGTMVIKLLRYKKIQISLDEYDYLGKNYKPRYPKASDLSLDQIDIITRTLDIKGDLFSERIAALSKKVQQKLDIQRQESSDYEFLQRILRDYQYYALEEI